MLSLSRDAVTAAQKDARSGLRNAAVMIGRLKASLRSPASQEQSMNILSARVHLGCVDLQAVGRSGGPGLQIDLIASGGAFCFGPAAVGIHDEGGIVVRSVVLTQVGGQLSALSAFSATSWKRALRSRSATTKDVAGLSDCLSEGAATVRRGRPFS